MTDKISDIVALDVNYLQGLEEIHNEKPKKNKMTKAEKKTIKERKQIEFKRADLYAQYKRELEMSKKNYNLQYNKWLDLMGGLKMKELQIDLKHWIAKTDYWFKEKDITIERLLQEFREAEELNERSHERRVKLIKYLEEIYQAFIDSARLNYETQIEDILSTFLEEVKSSEEINQNLSVYCDNIQNTSAVVFKRKILDFYKTFLDKQEQCISEEINKRYMRRDQVLHKMRQMRRNLCDFVDLISDTTLDAEKYMRLGYMMQRSNEYTTDARRLDELECKQRETYTKLNRELVSMEIDRQKRLNELKIEHLYYVRVRQFIEHKTEAERSQTFEKMKVLSTAAYAVCKKLKEYGKYGELLLSLAANCRKLETDGDFPAKFANVEDINLTLETVDVEQILNMSFKDFQENMNLLKNFWQRMACVSAQNMILEKQKHILLQEKATLIESLKKITKIDSPEELQSALKVEFFEICN